MQTLATLKRRVMAAVSGMDKAIAMALTQEELIQAINEAIDDVRTEMPYDISPDETVTLVSSTYEYSLAGKGFSYIHRIIMADEAGVFTLSNVVYDHMWGLLPGPVLKFDDRLWEPINGRVIRIEGQSFQANLAADTDVCYISDAFIVNRAAAGLLGEKGAMRLRMAEDARQRAPFHPYPTSVLARN